MSPNEACGLKQIPLALALIMALFVLISCDDDSIPSPQQDANVPAPVAVFPSESDIETAADDKTSWDAFTSISAGSTHSCGVRNDGNVICWGDSVGGQASPPTGTFTSVSSGSAHTCGLRADGSVVCWGDDWEGRASPPEGVFISVSVGRRHSCGVRDDNSVACWGYDAHGRSTPPEGHFIAVSAGENHTCAVRDKGTLACWGYDSHVQTSRETVSSLSV